MTNDNDKNEFDKSTRKVGYKSPPEESRFKKGQSGNPKGRPKGTKNKLRGNAGVVDNFLLEEGMREVTVNDGGKEVTMPMAKTIIRTQTIRAAKGDKQSAKLILAMLKIAEDKKEEQTINIVKKAVEYKRWTEAYIKDRSLYGSDFEMPVPHPDHIVIDWETLEISFTGPCDQEHLSYWKVSINIIAQSIVELEMKANRLKAAFDENQIVPIDDEYDFTLQCYKQSRKNVSSNDPLWLEYGPQYKKNWIDFFYYYGPSAHIAEEQLIDDSEPNYSLNFKHRCPPELKPELEAFNQRSKKFNAFMREYLKWYWEEDWPTRLEDGNYEMRDIDLDSDRYDHLFKCVTNLDMENAKDKETLFWLFHDMETGALEKYTDRQN